MPSFWVDGQASIHADAAYSEQSDPHDKTPPSLGLTHARLGRYRNKIRVCCLAGLCVTWANKL
jgi:hypothetical protein